MSKFSHNYRILKTACGIGIGALFTAVAYERADGKQGVLASWTTNFKPSVQWENNWDK